MTWGCTWQKCWRFILKTWLIYSVLLHIPIRKNTFAYDVVELNLNKWLDIRILKTWLMYFKFVKCIISIILCYIFFSKGCGESNFLSKLLVSLFSLSFF